MSWALARQPIGLGELTGLGVATVYPWRFGLGLAYTRPGLFAVAADVTVQLPISYRRLDLDADTYDLIKNHFVNDVELKACVNAAVGVEAWLSDITVLRAGVFTNRSATPEVSAILQPPVLADVDLYGASLSLGFKGDDRAVNVGVEVQMGEGDDAVLDNIKALWKPEFSRTRRSHQRVLFFISGAMDFAKKTARDIVKEDEDASTAP